MCVLGVGGGGGGGKEHESGKKVFACEMVCGNAYIHHCCIFCNTVTIKVKGKGFRVI